MSLRVRMEKPAHESPASTASTSPTGLSRNWVLPLKLMRPMPSMAATKPRKKFSPGRSARSSQKASSPAKNGEIATITPTFDAKVYVSAIFSSKKYRVTPHRPAQANSTSCRLSVSRKKRGQASHKAA